MAQNTRTGTIIGVVAIALVGIAVGAYIMNAHKETPGERIGNAIDDVADGVENASEDLRDRSPAEKVGDAIEDTGDAIKDAARKAQ